MHPVAGRKSDYISMTLIGLGLLQLSLLFSSCKPMLVAPLIAWFGSKSQWAARNAMFGLFAGICSSVALTRWGGCSISPEEFLIFGVTHLILPVIALRGRRAALEYLFFVVGLSVATLSSTQMLLASVLMALVLGHKIPHRGKVLASVGLVMVVFPPLHLEREFKFFVANELADAKWRLLAHEFAYDIWLLLGSP